MATYPTAPYAADITDYKFFAFGNEWSLSIEYEDAGLCYTPVLWIRDGQVWRWVADWHAKGGGTVQNSEEIKARFGSPQHYLQACCDWAMEQMHAYAYVPPPTPGDALSRALYHAKKSIFWDGEKLTVPTQLIDPT